MTIIVGGIVGWLASILMRTNAQMGILANVIVGIIGSYLGTVIAGALKIGGGGSAMGWIIAVSGAAILIAILKTAGVFRRLPN
jgi:uncharacterized membrane protein YeaQ/YmgE (transglycosylase-associated protein family)